MRAMSEPKVALVTGAGRGIGRDIAQRLAREGYACGLIARTKSQLEETAELIVKAGGKALVTPTDVSKREQVLASVEAVERELGPISVLDQQRRRLPAQALRRDHRRGLRLSAQGQHLRAVLLHPGGGGQDGGARRRNGHLRAGLGDARRAGAVLGLHRVEGGAARDRGVARL